MASCAGDTGIPVDHLSLIKATGCIAFRHSKVDHADLIKWILKYRELEEDEVPTDRTALAYRADRYIAADIRRQINEYRDSIGMPRWPWLPGQPLPEESKPNQNEVA